MLRKALTNFFKNISRKWEAACRKREKLFENNRKWLEEEVTLPLLSHSSTPKKVGRPATEFALCSERSKRRKTEPLRTEYSSGEIAYAAQMSLREKGQVDAAAVLNEVVFSTPTRAQKYRKSYKDSSTKEHQLSSDEALSVLVEAKLTRHQYSVIRGQAKNRFPSYKIIQEAKKNVTPTKKQLQ